MAISRSIKGMTLSYKLFLPLIIIGAIILTGVIGFMVIERYSFLDALYMTVVTVTTVGYEEVHELSKAGMIFNILLIISSFATFAYALAKITQYVVDGEKIM
jgi:voltage-gated potassium channel